MRRLGPALALGVALASPVSCREEARPVRVAIHSAPLGLDPHLANESLTAAVLANLYDGLTEFDDDYRVRPALASGWRNPDETTWVFALRRGVRFHDGRLLTAADVVFSLERARSHPLSGVASYLVEVEAVKALDALTVEIRTRRPVATLLGKLTPIFVVPAGAPERIVAPVGTGSYRLARAGPSRVEMFPARDSWRGASGSGPLSFVVASDPAERLRLLLAGEVELAADLREDAVKALWAAEGCPAVTRPGSAVEFLHLSDVEPRFADRRVREAIHLAIDREGYVAAAHYGLGKPVGQLAVPGVFGFAPDLRAPARDLGRARELLRQAGYPDGLDLELAFRPGRRADVLAAQLAEAGIRARLREEPWPSLYDRLRRGEVGFYFGGVVSPTAESSDVLDGYVHSRGGALGFGASNHCRYANPRADALIEAASASLDLARRRGLLQEAMRVVMQDLRFVPVAGLYQVYGVRSGVEVRARVDMRLLGREIVRR